jgi:hypothetical protein
VNRRNPPKVATWLLQRLGVGWHSESLAGDLIEQYAEGRSRLWYWRQVAVAIVVTRARAFRTRSWPAAMRVFYHLVTEMAVVLAIVSAIDQSRHTHDLQAMMSPTFIATMACLLAIASLGLLLSLKSLQSKPPHAPVKHLIVLFAVIALGAGTLTWASTARQKCSTDTCLCQKVEQRSVTETGQ